LFGVEVVELGLVGVVDLGDLLLDVRDLVLHVALLREDLVEVLSLLVVLVLDVHEEGLDVLGLGVAAVLVEREVVVRELALIPAHVLDQRRLLLLQVLSSLLQSVLLQTRLSLNQTRIHLLQIRATTVHVLLQCPVLFLKFFIFIALFGVEVVELGLVGVIDLGDLLLHVRYLILHVALLSEHLVQVLPLLVILVLDMHKECLDVFGLGVGAVLVQGEVVVGQFALVLAHVLDQRLVLALQSHVRRVVLVDLLHLALHLVDFIHNLRVLTLQQVVVVVAVVNLSTRTCIVGLEADYGDTVIGDGPLDNVDLGILADS